MSANTRVFNIGGVRNYELTDSGEAILPKTTAYRRKKQKQQEVVGLQDDIVSTVLFSEENLSISIPLAVEGEVSTSSDKPVTTTELWNKFYDEFDGDEVDDADVITSSKQLTPREEAMLLLDLLKWEKFKRTKTELMFDLQTTRCCLRLPFRDEERIGASGMSGKSDIAFPSSIYMLLKNYGSFARRMKMHYICNQHKRLVGSLLVNEPIKGVHFDCDHEDKHTVDAAVLHQSCMLNTSVADALQKILSKYGRKVLAVLQKRHTVLKEPASGELTSAIYGEYYRRLKLAKYDLTLLLHSDAAEMSDSSSLKIFIIHLTLMELPEEKKADNIVLNTIWIGPNENFPHRKVIFHPLLAEMKQLSEEGIVWAVEGAVIHSRVFISLVACDGQERWPLAGLSTFHHQFGCTMCTVRSQLWKNPKDASSHKKVYLSSNVEGMDRNDTAINIIASKIMKLDKVLRETARMEVENQGVSETSVLCPLEKLDLIIGLPPDILHQYFKGVIPNFIDGLNLTEQQKQAIDSHSSMMDIPSCFSRKPRSWKERSRFKANEYRDVIFIGAFVLHRVLSEDDFKLWALLVSVGTTITKDVIDHSDIASLEKECPLLVRSLRTRFGDSFMVYNVHQILHFPRYVRLLGSMSQYCTFAYEGAIGSIVSTIKGFFNGCREVARTMMIQDIAEYLAGELDPTSLDGSLLDLIDRSSRTVFRSNSVQTSTCTLFKRIDSLRALWHSDIASWTVLYEYCRMNDPFSQEGILSGSTYSSVSVHKFTISC